jgi:hypothetical protein
VHVHVCVCVCCACVSMCVCLGGGVVVVLDGDAMCLNCKNSWLVAGWAFLGTRIKEDE